MLTVEQVAEICHEANRAYCRALGDVSQPLWDHAPQWQKDSACSGVRFHLENPEAGPSGSHVNWMCDKLAEGWKYGAAKNPETKEHPCMVEYEELPVEQRLKDSIFTAIVHSLRESIIPDATPAQCGQ